MLSSLLYTEGENIVTEQELRNKIVSVAKGYLGYKESDGSHRKIIDIYNNATPLPSQYRVKYTDAWCATYVSAMGVKAGLSDIILRECSCERMIALYKKAGRWIENDEYAPQIGDIIFYDWDDNGIGDNKGHSDHVGIVIEVNGTSLKIIEGNFNNSVGCRSIKVNGKYIRGYGIPNYTSKATSTTQNVVINSNVKIEPAKSFSKSIAGTYKTTTFLNIRSGAGTDKKKIILTIIPKNKKVTCYGYYTNVNGLKWYYVTYKDDNGTRFNGFVSSKYLKK